MASCTALDRPRAWLATALLGAEGLGAAADDGRTDPLPIETPAGYRALNEASLAAYLADLPVIASRLGGEPGGWKISEVGDGNLNLVFIVEGPAGDVCVKQALPYVRLVGESWPLPLSRAFFEHEATMTQAAHAPGRVPAPLHYDPAMFCMVMERLTPHVIMRRGMVEGVVYPRFAEHITAYLAATLYGTCDLAMPAARKKALIARFCGNTELCRITEDLIFTDPYMVCERNHWTSPELDDPAAAIRADEPLKRAVAGLKLKFLSQAQALLHGDMHTGSIMVTETDTKVIDPEFAFVGPIAFDVGKLIGNLLLSQFSQRGHEGRPGERDAYRAWILETAEAVWTGFAERFVELWATRPTGDAYPPAMFAGEEGAASLATAREVFMADLFTDAVGFAGCSMIRRTLGLAHNIDLELIPDRAVKVTCEQRTLEMARDLVVNARGYKTIGAVTAKARALEGGS